MISAEDRRVLAFIAAQPLVLSAHVRVLLGEDGTDADTRLAALVAGGLVRRDRLNSQPDTFRITSKGLGVGTERVGSSLVESGDGRLVAEG